VCVCVITGQPSSVHRGVRPGKYPNHMGYTPRVVGHQPNMSSQVNSTQSIKEYDLENIPTTWDTPQGSLGTNIVKLISPSIIVILNSIHRGVSSQVNPTRSIEEYDLGNVSQRCNHQHSLSVKGAFSSTPSLSQKYSNFDLARGLVRTSTICSYVGRYCTGTAFLCTISRM